jgi:hypothetical protein
MKAPVVIRPGRKEKLMTIDAIKKGLSQMEPAYVLDENAEPHAILKIKEKIMAIPIKSEKFEKAVKYHMIMSQAPWNFENHRIALNTA